MKKTSFVETTVGLMLVAIVAIMPLIVRFVWRPLPPELTPYFPDREFPGGFYLDMFTYWKGLFVYLGAIVIAFIVAGDWITTGRMPDYKEFFKRTPVLISLSYLLFVIISAVASPYSFTAWFGTYARGEGAFMWISYFVVFFAAMYFVTSLENARLLLFGLAFSSIIMGLIGVSQFIGRDFFTTDFARWIITVGDAQMAEPILVDGEWVPRRSLINPVFTIAHGTLFNPNTFGKYTAMISPVLLLAALTYTGKKFVNIIFLVAGGLMLLGVFGSSSLGGLVGIVTAAGVLLVTFIFSRGISGKKLAFAAGPVVLTLLLAILFVTPLNERVMFLFGRLGDAIRADTTAIQDYIFDGNTMTVTNEDGVILNLTVNHMGRDGWVTVTDANGNEITPHRDATMLNTGRGVEYTFDIPGYRNVRIEKYSDIFLYHHRTSIPFFLTLEDGRLYGVSPTRMSVDLHRDIPHWGFAGRETWGSNRGYIWSRSFPLMFTPRTLTIGYGPDTFINIFPKYEMPALQRFFNSPFIIVDKAHNIVIQTWISTGGISAILLVSLLMFYLFTTFRSLVKTKNEPIFSYGLRLGLLCGISAYFMSSMATDTTIGSTGVFFVLLGVGFGLNYLRANPVSEK